MPRAITRLCLAALILNLFAPIAWATLLPPVDSVSALCAEPADTGAPAHPASHSDASDRAPHCPLCVLFGGSGWAPPASAILVTAVAPARVAPAIVDTSAAPALPRTLRPTPRAPPASI